MCCGVTRERRLLFYDYVQRAPVVAVALQVILFLKTTRMIFDHCTIPALMFSQIPTLNHLQEWPTALAVCDSAPLLALAGASGRVKMVSFPRAIVGDQESGRHSPLGKFNSSCSFSSRANSRAHAITGTEMDVVDVALHTHTIHSLYFCGGTLLSASDDEVAHWELLPLP